MTLLAVAALLVVAFPGSGAAADPDIGPAPGACPPGTPIPYPARHDYCMRTSEYAALSVEPGSVSSGSELTVSVELGTAACARLVTDRVYPCVESIGWDDGGELCGIGSRLIANDRTFFNTSTPPFYYRPFSFRPVSPCRIGTVDPSTDLSRVFKLVHNPGLGPIPASWLVIGPQIRVQLSATEARFVWPEAVTRLSPTPVDNTPPSASFTWAPETDDPLTIDFDGSGSTDDKGVARYEWDFDDGNTGTGETAQHTFREAGTYSVKLTVFDEEGLSGTTNRDVVVEGHSIDLTLDAATPQAQGVQRTQRIVYTLDARPDEQADELALSATVPAGFVDVDESSISGGGVLSDDGSTIEWELADTSGTDPPLTFAVTVKGDVPRSVLFISTEARARARFGDDEASATTLRQTPLVQFGLVLTGEISSERGDHVVPGQTATVRMQADAREQADEIVLVAKIPRSSSLVAGTISDNGVRESERTIRWRFTNVTQTPSVRFDIKVDPLKDIPKDLKKLSSKTTAQAAFGSIPEAAENTLEIAIVRPTTIRGVVYDIVNPSPRLAVSTPPLGGIDIRLSELLSGKTVDTTTSATDGSFTVEAGKPMRYVLEAVRQLALESLGPRQVRSKHILEVREDGQVFVDGRGAAQREDGSLEPLDVHVPVSLVARTDALIVGLGKAEIPYWIFLKFDAGRALDFARGIGLPVPDVRFDATQVTQVFDTMLALQGPQIDSTGQYQAHFRGLYEPGAPATQRDGWNALVRLNAMLAQLGADSRSPMRFGDAVTIIRPVALAVALQVTTMVVKAMVKAINAKLAAAGKRPLARLPLDVRFKRIIGMTDGIGFLAPYLVDVLNSIPGVKLNKADWMEWIAKGTRYATDCALIFMKKVGAVQTLIDDLAFEAIFNVVRMGVTGLMLQGWIDVMAQKELDRMEFLRSTFAGSTSAIDRFVLDTDARLATGWLSAGNLQKISAVESTVVSMVRGLDGVYQLWRGVYGYGPAHVDDIDIDPRRRTLPRGPKLLKALDKVLTRSFGAGADGDAAFQRLALGVNVLAVETGLVGLEALGLEVQKIAGALTVGVDGSSARLAHPGRSAGAAADSASVQVPAGTTAATETPGRTRAAAVGRSALRATLAAYRNAISRTISQIDGRTAGQLPPRFDALDRAAMRTTSPLELAVRRALLLQAKDVDGNNRTRTYGVILAAGDFAAAQLAATAALESRRSDGKDRVRATRRVLMGLDESVRTLERALENAPALEHRLPGTLSMTPLDLELPGDGAIRSGRPFTVRLTVWNAGSTPSSPSSLEVMPAPGLELLSRTTRNVDRLRPNGKATVTWRLRATQHTRLVASDISIVLRRASAVIGNLNVAILASSSG